MSSADLAPQVTRVANELINLVAWMRRNNVPEMDVRLVSDEDGCCHFATGNVSYDTSHGAACGEGVLYAHDTTDDVTITASDLVDQIVEALSLDGGDED